MWEAMMRVVSLIGLVVLAVAGVFAFRTAAAADTEARTVEAEADRYRVMVIRGQMIAMLMDELNALVLGELGVETPEALAIISEDRQQAAERFRQEVATVEPVAGQNEQALESLSGTLKRTVDIDPATASLDEYYELSFELLEDSWSGYGSTEDGFHDLVALSVSPQFLLNDGLDPYVAVSTVEPSALAAPYWEWRTEVATDGWQNLGPTLDDPLPSWTDVISDDYADELASIAEGLASSGLYAHDAWRTELGQTDLVRGQALQSPLTLEQFRTAAAVQSASFSSLVESRGERISLEYRLAAASDRETKATYRLVAFAAFGLAGVVLLHLMWGSLQSRRRLAHVSMTDPLTGVGNRRHLETTVPARLGSTRHCHHAIGMIDLDNFKMVNDSWGHATGDAVLVAVARNLVSALGEWEQGKDRDSGAVRIGGDEFLITLHSDSPIEVDEITRILRDRLEVPLSLDELDKVTINVSLGFSPCHGVDDFQSSMVAADLAAYEDKARRREGDVVLSIQEPVPTMELD